MTAPQDMSDRERLTALWLEAESSVQAYVFAAVRRVQDAEDVVQQVALTAARRFEEYDSNRPFVGWALWLARSRVVDHYRKQGRERLVFSDAMLERFEKAILDEHEQRGPAQHALERCIEKLPEKARRMVELRYENDQSMQGVADAIGSTAASVRVMLFRVRNQLAACVKAEVAKETT